MERQHTAQESMLVLDLVEVLEEVVTQVRTAIQRVRGFGISTEHCSMIIIVLQPRRDSHRLNLYHPYEQL